MYIFFFWWLTFDLHPAIHCLLAPVLVGDLNLHDLFVWEETEVRTDKLIQHPEPRDLPQDVTPMLQDCFQGTNWDVF